jgi:hypothetical protein
LLHKELQGISAGAEEASHSKAKLPGDGARLVNEDIDVSGREQAMSPSISAIYPPKTAAR